eukprot:g447.t1
MFGSKKPETAPPPAPASAEPARKTSEIAEGLTIVGELDGEGDVRLDGRLEGNVRCRALVIGRSGELVGRVSAQEVSVEGTVRGDIRATQVTLAASAVVVGDVAHEVLEVAAGAKIEGRYSRASARSEAAPESKPDAKAEQKLEKRPAVEAPKEPPPRAPQRPLAKPGNGQRPQIVAGASAPTANPPAKPDA